MIISKTNDMEAVIEELLPRKCRLLRPPVANVQQVVVLFSLKDPPPNLLLLDRLLVLVESNFLEAVVCLNKIDLVNIKEVSPLVQIYKKAGYRVILTSALTGEGLEQVKQFLKGKVSVITGPSGSGKSTLLNNIQSGLKLKVGVISGKTRRGKQTTRHVELLSLDFGGLVADSPGFSQLDLVNLKSEELTYFFPEIAERAGHCRFAGCEHVHEPSCQIKKAVQHGDISSSRYNHYLIFLKEVKEAERSY